MGRYLRKLNIENKECWERMKAKASDWLSQGDIPPEILDGWLDQNLSIWKIEGSNTEEFKRAAEEVLFGIYYGSAKQTSQIPKQVMYLTFDESAVNDLEGITISNPNGSTGYPKLDLSKKHFEISKITGKKLCNLLLNIIQEKSCRNFEVYKKTDYQKVLDNFVNQETKTQRVIVAPNITTTVDDLLTISPTLTESRPDAEESSVLIIENPQILFNPEQDSESNG